MIFTILKILGLILLVILCVVLLLLLLVLLVPVRYAAEFEYDKEHMRLEAKVTWLAIIRFYVNLKDKDFSYRLKVLFFRIMDSTAVPKEKKVKQYVKAQAKTVEDAAADAVQETVTEEKQKTERTPEEPLESSETQEERGEPQQNRKRKTFHIPFRPVHPADIYDKIIRTLMDFSRKLDKICAQIVSEENREMVRYVLEQIKKLFWHIRPRKHGIYLKLGMNDPSLTGQIFGAYSVINNVLGLHFVLEPDFDHEVLETKIFLKGHVRVISLLVIAVRLYGNKTLRKLIRRK